jgi:hypothetical protein
LLRIGRFRNRESSHESNFRYNKVQPFELTALLIDTINVGLGSRKSQPISCIPAGVEMKPATKLLVLQFSISSTSARSLFTSSFSGASFRARWV